MRARPSGSEISLGMTSSRFQNPLFTSAFPLNTTLPSELKVNFPLPSLPRVVFSSSLSKIVSTTSPEKSSSRSPFLSETWPARFTRSRARNCLFSLSNPSISLPLKCVSSTQPCGIASLRAGSPIKNIILFWGTLKK